MGISWSGPHERKRPIKEDGADRSEGFKSRLGGKLAAPGGGFVLVMNLREG